MRLDLLPMTEYDGTSIVDSAWRLTGTATEAGLGVAVGVGYAVLVGDGVGC